MGFICYSHGLKKTSKYDSTHDWSIGIYIILGYMLGHVIEYKKMLKYFVV